jgi:hypothetical protein
MPTPSQRATLAIFTATIFLSALLLFSVQPMFAKMVLPVLGGAPAVWAVSMCFFQALLLAGYAYAHLLDRHAPLRLCLPLHLGVLTLALLALPVATPNRWIGSGADNAYLQLIVILAVGVGVPFFALAANAPLLQAWFARVGHSRSADAYSLYRASNAGSLVALAAYPTLIEPLLPLGLQSRLWTAGFVLLFVGIGVCGWLARNNDAVVLAAEPETDIATSDNQRGRARERACWAFLAFVPSGLLVAFTTYVTTDLASAPLLWVIPLAIYLATFIGAFRPKPVLGARVLALLQPVSIALTLVLMEWDASFAWVLSCLAGTLAFTVTSLICHRQLYESRPETARLTDFYLWLSVGGALGGIFSALVAPHLFSDVLEFPLLLGVGMLARLGRTSRAPRSWRLLFLGLALAAAGVLIASFLVPMSWTHALRLYVLVGLGAALIAAARWPALELATTLALVLAVALLPNGNRPLHVARSFYGTHKVIERPGSPFRVLMHGVTLHGAQMMGRQGADARPLPLTYYHPSGPLARGVQLARLAAGNPEEPLRVGVIGLGTGAIACHARPGDRWRFFELDPEVIEIARNPAYFTYLSACQPEAEIVVGDARLTIAREPASSFDYLVVDAFSSDAIPVHLLTVEALELYLRLLSPRGLLAIHASNRNLDLTPVIESNIARIAGLKGIYAQGGSGGGAIRSQVILIARDESLLAAALEWPRSRRLDSPSVAPWTDDYSDVLSPFLRRLRAKLGEALE